MGFITFWQFGVLNWSLKFISLMLFAKTLELPGLCPQIRSAISLPNWFWGPIRFARCLPKSLILDPQIRQILVLETFWWLYKIWSARSLPKSPNLDEKFTKSSDRWQILFEGGSRGVLRSSFCLPNPLTVTLRLSKIRFCERLFKWHTVKCPLCNDVYKSLGLVRYSRSLIRAEPTSKLNVNCERK